ncbi:YLP motif-containing protein 1 [Oncorhynchus mykiss]|uniref:YLP motif-containing protein 1 n=1 Tax=Oncorhynchus mykiss TaxID=8022 RepID=UPI0018776EB4|nr:YLP motif-containing protein 1 [Oncorhynchus mykiss]
MYPWGTNYGGGHQPPSQQNFGAPSPQGEGFAGGFGSYGAATPAAAPGSTFNSLREQHLQQMQQLQQLHHKQLQSVLHHDRNVDANPYGGGGTAAESWQGSSGYGYGSTGAGAPSPYQDEYQTMQAGPPGPQQPPLPPQSPQSKEAQPPPPDSTLPVPTQNNGTPATKEVNTKESLASKDQAHSSGSEEEKPDFTSMSLQEQQQYWYKQHLQNLQRLKVEKAKQGQGDGPTPRPHSTAAPPPPSEPPKNAPPPPPPKEEPPPPPPPEDKTPAPLAQDPAEAARLKQLQSAAAQWQQAQQQRAGYQYQALMRHHAQLQVILNQYQQCIQQPAQLETMSMAMQLSHYEKQQQQFDPVFGDWGRTFSQWQEQFQSYPHKDQLQDYELQWKQWQEQMNSTSAHLQERVTTLRATQQQYGGGVGSDGGGQYGADQYGSSDRYGSGGYGDQYNQYGQYPLSGPDSQIQQGHMVSPSVPSQTGSQPSSTSGSMLQGPRPGQQGPSNTQRMGTPTGKPHQGPQAEQYNLSGTPGRGAGPGGRGAGPGGRGVARSPVPPPGQPPPFQSPRGPRFDGPRGNGPLFDQQQQSGQQQRFNAPPGPRFNEQRQRFNQPGPRGPGPRFGQQGSRFDQPPPRQNPPGCFERPPGPLVPHIGPQPKPDTSKDTQPPQGKTETPAGSKPPGNKPTGPAKPGAEPEDMSEDMVDSLDGFFVQNDPIPQTKAEADAAAASKGSTVNMEKVSPTGPAGTKPQVSTDASVSPKTDPPLPEYWGEEGDPYWMDRRPPPHGMRGGPRAPFHPGRSRPPRGRPGFMHQGGPRRPLPPPRGAMDPHDPLGSPMGPHDDMDPLGPPLHRDYNPRGPPMHHDMMERDMRGRPPPPREMMDRDLMGPGDHPPYHDTDRDLGWPPGPGRPPNHGRVGPRGPPPLEMMMERGGMRRRPMGPRGAPMGRARGMMQQPHEEMEGYPHDGYGEEFGGPDDDRYGRPLPPRDWPKRPPHDYDREEEYYPHEPPRGGEWDRERGGPLPERDYPPPDRFREDEWTDERDQDRPPYAYEGDRDRPPYAYEGDRDRPPYAFEGEEHGRGGKLQSRGYPDDPPYRHNEPPYLPPPEWERSRPPLPERNYPSDFEEHRPHYDGRAEPPRSDLGIPPPTSSQALAPPTTGPDSSQEPASQGTGPGILALSQRQHEIILKAAHELKLIREMQENLTEGEALSITSDPKTELPAGLLGLEIPPEVRSALQATNLISNSTAAKTVTWGDTNPQDTGYMSSVPPVPNAPVIPKTVDYGHGHDLGAATVERISYGERIVLRPDPLPDRERSYEKELLGPLRDPYHRDLYYDRRPVDPYMERREYSRERDMYREKAPMDFERERYERERYPPRDDSKHSMDVDDRQPPGHPRPGPPPPRPGYRDRDMREREGSRTSRDREDTYGRPGGYDRPPFERGPERGPERYDHGDERGPERYNHGASAYGERRSYPEERGGGGPTSSHPPPPPPTAPPSRMEKKPETKNVEDLLKLPGRDTRPERIVIIMRGLPGSGKSHVAKLIRDKEVECGGAPPRVLGLDDYFMTEVEKVEKDPETGKRIKLKCLEYEYEAEMEDTYRNSMLKTFRKTLDDGFFPFLIIDAINDRVKYFDQFWSAAKTKGFEVYLAEITADNQTCAKRNAHGRKMDDIQKMSSNWESSPRHMVRLDVRSLLQDAAIEEVEMEDLNPDDEPLKEPKKEEEEEDIKGYIPQSKWEMDTSDAKLDKLDGLVMGGKRKREGDDVAGMDDFLQLPDDYATRHSEPGKKRVRWADLEEQKDAERKRDIGFVVGQTDWEKITDQSGQIAQRALNRTKYF